MGTWGQCAIRGRVTYRRTDPDSERESRGRAEPGLRRPRPEGGAQVPTGPAGSVRCDFHEAGISPSVPTRFF